ncbi:probable methionine--tRNA ligase [Salvia splendens]|uniref:probable methionine--tRNA ligase n=1 Tax=Salvia splendens TaxID=180675 RepID=UPI001C269EAB|nr:probable methionine--tRNA ligase [Salvia splendens]
MEKVKLKQGLKIAMTISGVGNAYLQESQFWKLYREDRPSCSVVMKTSLGLVCLSSSICHLKRNFRSLMKRVTNATPLFREMRDEEVELFRQRFAGSQADRLARAEGETKKLSQKLNETKI